MLFLNGERYTLKTEDLDRLQKDFGYKVNSPKPVSINYPESSYHYDPVNKKRLSHQNHPILLNSSFLPEGGSVYENWLYCQIPDYKDGKLVGGQPRYLHFKNFLNINDAELLFFLAYCSPLRENSPLNKNSSAPLFTIAQPALEAKTKIERELGMVRKKSLILDKENGLPLDVIQELCTAFILSPAIDDSDPEGSEDIMRVELDKYVSTPERLKIFFAMLENDEGEREVRAMVGKAYEANIIGYDKASQSIVYLDEEGKIIEPAKKVKDAGRHKEEAVKHFKGKVAKEKLRDVLQERLGFSLSGMEA